MQRTYDRRNGDPVVFKEKLTLDGKECKNSFRDFPKTSTVNWADDTKALIINAKIKFARDGNNFEINTTEKW